MAFSRASLYDHEGLLQRKKEAEQDPAPAPSSPPPPPPPVEAVDPSKEETQVALDHECSPVVGPALRHHALENELCFIGISASAPLHGQLEYPCCSLLFCAVCAGACTGSSASTAARRPEAVSSEAHCLTLNSYGGELY